MTQLQDMLDTLAHRQPEHIPMMEDFGDANAEALFLPAMPADPLERQFAYAQYLGNWMIGAGGGGLQSRRVDEAADHYLLQWENGAIWRIHLRPQWWREYCTLPVQDEADLARMPLPDPDAPARYEGVAERVRAVEARGYFPTGGIMGFFSGVWYFCRPFEAFLEDLVLRPGFAHALVERIGAFNLAAARQLLERGVRAIGFPDDLGHNRGTFIAPRIYREFFLPWHRRLAELCHSYGAYVDMHSHGNINAIMDDLCEAGIDILNPVGPSDGMDLAQLKRRYGQRMTFMGGVSKFVGRMTRQELYDHVAQVFRVGTVGGGFIAFSEGNIPIDMDPANVAYYLDLRRELSARYGRGR